ncbi:dimethyl sulfoxide reductase anchor subunit [Pontiellaceae bacterium B1224]|nr:dimethyl sulfoxide reductase anchor subunit [Pontiellaceae bacterium B1224]
MNPSSDTKQGCCGGGCSGSKPTTEAPAKPCESAPVDRPDIVGFRTEGRESQTRFHFHMDLCIGCHACEVACGEQNNLPAETQWRRVGEVQSGTFPDTQSFFLSSGCNHCLDAACAKGCPVDAYQVNDKGIVIHLDDVCIGCGYCTWNCPYGVPTMQTDRRIVTKCDLCHNRLEDGQDPACVAACPAGAIEVETVAIAQIFAEHMENGVGPDMPAPNLTIPSTKITLPEGMDVAAFTKVDQPFVKPEHPHTPLIVMTVLTQLGFGGFCTVFMADLIRTFFFDSAALGHVLGWLAPTLMGIVALSLGASTLHLGRPIHAGRAMKNWKSSWLSREVLGLSAFAGAAMVYALILFVTEGLGLLDIGVIGGSAVRLIIGFGTVICGIAGIYCSSMIYRVPARPAWDSRKTTIDFFDVAAILGPAAFIVAAMVATLIAGHSIGFLTGAMQTAALFAAIAFVFKHTKNAYIIKKWHESDTHELKASAEMRITHFFRLRMIRNSIGIAGLLALIPFMSSTALLSAVGLLAIALLMLMLFLAVSFINRYIFFVSVVPRNIPGNYVVASKGEAH